MRYVVLLSSVARKPFDGDTNFVKASGQMDFGDDHKAANDFAYEINWRFDLDVKATVMVRIMTGHNRPGKKQMSILMEYEEFKRQALRMLDHETAPVKPRITFGNRIRREAIDRRDVGDPIEEAGASPHDDDYVPRPNNDNGFDGNEGFSDAHS